MWQCEADPAFEPELLQQARRRRCERTTTSSSSARARRVGPALAEGSRDTRRAAARKLEHNIKATSARGFGNAPRDLNRTRYGQQSDGIRPRGVSATGTIMFGTCTPEPSVTDFNGMGSVGGDEPQPQADDQSMESRLCRYSELHPRTSFVSSSMPQSPPVVP